MLICLALILAISPAIHVLNGQQARTSVLSTPEEIQSEFTGVPCEHKKRAAAVRELFERVGAPAADIHTQKVRGEENLVIKWPGVSSDTIVIGAHYDFTDLGCGAIDNWTGIVTIAHLYKTIRQLESRKSLLFVAFANEEQGLRGSKAMAEDIPKEELPRYCAMINIDSFGLASPFALFNTSSSSMMKLAADAASTLKIPFYTVALKGADADSSSFLKRGIPAMTLSGLSNEWPSILHTVRDQKEIVNGASVYWGYRLALFVWGLVDAAPCDAFREPQQK